MDTITMTTALECGNTGYALGPKTVHTWEDDLSYGLEMEVFSGV